MRYYVRARDERRERIVSLQVVVHYLGNWYLIAWCRMRHGLRSFSLDSIETAHLTELKAQEVDGLISEEFFG